MRSQAFNDNYDFEDQDENPLTSDFICPNTIVAVRADAKSTGVVWFIRVTEVELIVSPSEENCYTDCYGEKLPIGSVFLKDRFLERDNIQTLYHIQT